MENSVASTNISLILIDENQNGTVAKIEGDSRFLSRVVSIGIVKGSEIKVLKNDGKSPLLIFVRDTVIALNRKESAQIWIEA
ncbi:FeoA family protein [Fibrobacter sp. UWH1]|uniref:FeoA family protein n=1 Tax=Fibrobacter sp. UWH1 TaxID=1964354 RepID=UPI001595D367|nr:FeoA family protein [Fibrobacter sp. UWH1]